MIRFSPSNTFLPNGAPTGRRSCQGEYCYCVGPCPTGDLPDILDTDIAPQRREVDATDSRIVIDLSVPTIGPFTGDIVHLFAGTDDTQDLNVGIRFTLSRPSQFSSYNWALYQDGVLIAQRGATINTLDRIYICIREDGTASGTLVDANQSDQLTVAGDVTIPTDTFLGVQSEITGWAFTNINWWNIRTSEKPQCPGCPLIGCIVCENFPVSLNVFEAKMIGLTNSAVCPGCVSQNDVWRSMGAEALANCQGLNPINWDCTYTEFAHENCELPDQWPDNRCTQIGNPCLGGTGWNQPVVYPQVTVGEIQGNRVLWLFKWIGLDCSGPNGGDLWVAEQITDNCDPAELNPLITGDRETGWFLSGPPVLVPCDFSTVTEVHVRLAGGSVGAKYDPCHDVEYRRGKPVVAKGRRKG